LTIRARCEEMHRGPMWLLMVNTVLLNFYKNHRPEWIKLFSTSRSMYRVRTQKPVPSGHNMSDLSHMKEKKSDFIAKQCEGCNTKELEHWKATGELPKRLKEKDILEASNEDDVLSF